MYYFHSLSTFKMENTYEDTKEIIYFALWRQIAKLYLKKGGLSS